MSGCPGKWGSSWRNGAVFLSVNRIEVCASYQHQSVFIVGPYADCHRRRSTLCRTVCKLNSTVCRHGKGVAVMGGKG